MMDKTRLADILEKQVSEGYDIIASKNVGDKDYLQTIMNFVDADKTVKQLRQEVEFDTAQQLLKNNNSQEITESEVTE